MSVLSPDAGNIEIASIAEWAIKASGDTGYVVFPFFRHGIVMFEALFSDDTEKRPDPYAYQFNASAEFLPTFTLLTNTNLLLLLGTNQIEHRIKLLNGQYIMSAPLNSTPSPTGFGTKWKFCSDNEFEDACYIELEVSRRLLPAEYLQVTTSANVDATASISSDTFYAFNNFSKADVIPSGISTFQLGTNSTYGDLVEYMRGTKFEAELLSAEDDRGQFVGNMVKVDFECEPMEGAESEMQAWNAIATRINYAKLNFNGGLTATLGTELGFKYDNVSESDMQDIAHGKVVASGIVTIPQFISIMEYQDIMFLFSELTGTINGAVDRYFGVASSDQLSQDYLHFYFGQNIKVDMLVIRAQTKTGGGNTSIEVLKNGSASGLKVNSVENNVQSDQVHSVSFTAFTDAFSFHLNVPGTDTISNVSITCRITPQ